MSTPLFALTTCAAIGSGIVCGTFFGFSTFIMKALGRLSPAESIRAMQAINKAAPRSAWFMLALFGTAVACVAVAVAAVLRWGDPGAAYQLAGSVVSVAAAVVTIAYHVPHNDALAELDPTTVDGAREWEGYACGWTRWNHVRVIAPLAGAVLLTLALRFGAPDHLDVMTGDTDTRTDESVGSLRVMHGEAIGR